MSNMTTPNLNMPYIASAQAQKHVTHNEALSALDELVQLAVGSRTTTQPPATPDDGVRFVVPDAATGEWLGQDGKIAAFRDGAWVFHTPQTGWLVFVADENVLIVWGQTNNWQTIWPDNNGSGSGSGSGTGSEMLSKLGINATADDINRLTVAASSTLLSHDGDDHRVVVNKADQSDTASLLFQSDFSGRAEMGLAGNDDMAIKVSSDGSNWRDALVIDAETGRVTLPQTPLVEGNLVNMLADGGRFAGSPEPGGLTVSTFAIPTWANLVNGAALSEHGRFYRNTSSFGGPAPAVTPEIQALVELLIDPPYRRYYTEFFVAELTAGTGMASSAITFGDGVLRRVQLATVYRPQPVKTSFSFYVMATNGSAGIPNYSNRTVIIDGAVVSQHSLIPDDGVWHHVVVLEGGSPGSSYRVSSNALRFFMSPGDMALLAFPAAIPGQIVLPFETGQVPSLTSW